MGCDRGGRHEGKKREVCVVVVGAIKTNHTDLHVGELSMSHPVINRSPSDLVILRR